MSESSLEEDQEISENVLNRIFYEQSTHDQITTTLRTYKDQSFGYLDAVTRLSHVFLRLLEKYSKQNVDMQVRTRRRARKKKQQEQPTQDGNIEDRMVEVEDVAEAQRVTSERKFDFSRFAAKFVNQGSVETFVALMRYYKDLDEEQLRRAHRFFYRVAFKMDSLLYLYRIDIIALFQRLIKGPLGLRNDGVLYGEWTELVRQIFRRLIKKMQERPALGIELLFSKIPSTMYYLEHGYDRELPAKKLRHVADVEVKPGMERADQIGIAVSVLINQSKSFFLNGVKELLLSAANERKAWENAESARQTLEGNSDDTVCQSVETSQDSLFGSQSQPAPAPGPQQLTPPRKFMPPSILVRLSSPEQREATQRDKHARLLLTLLDGQRLNSTDDDPTADTIWTLPSSITAAQLFSDLELVRTYEFAPPTYDDGKTAEDFLRRKAPVRRRTFEDEDSASNADDEDPNDTSLFLPGGPTTRRSSQSPARKPGRRRQRHTPDAAIDDDVLEAQREARRKAESARNSKIKSAMFVHESDDESDEERDAAFFALEEVRRRRATQLAISTAGSLKRAGADPETGKEKRRRTGGFPEGSEDDDDVREAESPNMPPHDSEAETEPDTTPPSSQLPSLGDENDEGDEADSDKENAVVAPKPIQRRAVRAGFVVESDSE